MATHSATTTVGDHPHNHPGTHPPHLQHHFVSSDQQFDAAKLGMWLFLVTEILLFSGMFVAYVVFRSLHPEVFANTSTLLDWRLGGLNTIILLASSLTVALAIRSIQLDDKKWLVRYLLITLGLAIVFLVVKYFEYTDKFSHGIFAGTAFNPIGDYAVYNVPYAAQFFSIYFVMTGIHAIHIIIGIAIISRMTYRAWKGHFNREWYTPVEMTGLYWHLVDLIWIFLFPLLYLV